METTNSAQANQQEAPRKGNIFRRALGALQPKKREPGEKGNKRNNGLILLLALILLLIAGYWFLKGGDKTHETKFAFASSHQFANPIIFFDGQGMRFEVMKTDRRMLKLDAPIAALTQPKTLIVEDGELDFIGTVKKGEAFIPLELFQIHNAREGKPTSPVTDCKTYLEVVSDLDTILVLIDRKHILKGSKVSPNRYVINFCETTREHEFQILSPNSRRGPNGKPVLFATTGNNGAKPSKSIRFRVQNPGQIVQTGIGAQNYSGGQSPEPTPVTETTDDDKKSAVTKVIFSTPRTMRSPWVYLNNNRLAKFEQNAAGTQVIFWVKQNGQPVNVRVGDSNCECQGSGRAVNPVLELPGYCECRDVQVTVNLDKGLDRFRNKVRIYIDGQLTDIALPPAPQPLVFSVRKAGRNQFVELKLALPDDSGRPGLFDVCDFTIPTELTTVNITPPCFCEGCPANVKISG
ncbi:MAG: hypothetical protein ACKVU2_18705 [Saprospiraceae bacterium]